MKLIAILSSGQRIPITGPFRVEAYEHDPADKGEAPVANYNVKLGVQRGTSSSAQSSAGSCSIVTPNRKTGYAIHLDIETA